MDCSFGILKLKKIRMMKSSGVTKDDTDTDTDDTEYYDWVMIPHCNPEDKKNGITFKGDTGEYLRARDIIFDFSV